MPEKATSDPKAFGLRHILYITDSILLIQIILGILNGYILCCHISNQHVGSGLVFKNYVLSGALIWCDVSVPVTRNAFKSENENYCLHQGHNYRHSGFCLGALKGISLQPGASVK